jgi:hypothetical protein
MLTHRVDLGIVRAQLEHQLLANLCKFPLNGPIQFLCLKTDFACFWFLNLHNAFLNTVMNISANN